MKQWQVTSFLNLWLWHFQMIIPTEHVRDFPLQEHLLLIMIMPSDRIVEAFSKSRFWENTVIFVVEDDSQSGWDHVSAYRTVSLVISPYSRLKSVNHTLLYAAFNGQDN